MSFDNIIKSALKTSGKVVDGLNSAKGWIVENPAEAMMAGGAGILSTSIAGGLAAANASDQAANNTTRAYQESITKMKEQGYSADDILELLMQDINGE